MACPSVKKEESGGEDSNVSPLDPSHLKNLPGISVKKEDELVTQIDLEENFVKQEVKMESRFSVCPEPVVRALGHETGLLEKIDPMDVLPSKLIMKCLSYLGPNDLVTVGQLSRAWRVQTRSPEVWRRVMLNIDAIRHADYPKLYRVLHAAPLLGCVAMRDGVQRSVKKALLSCTRQVQEIFSADMDLDEGTFVQRLLQRWAPSLEVVELESAPFAVLKALAETSMPRLRRITLDDTVDAIGTSELSLVPKTPPLMLHAVPDKGSLRELHVSSTSKVTTEVALTLMRAHRDTLTEVLLDWAESEGCNRLPASVIMEAVAQCHQLTGAALDCNRHLDLLRVLPKLQTLFVWLSEHRSGNEEGHAGCIAAINTLPLTIRHLMVQVWEGDSELVLERLVRIAPLRLRCLKTFIVSWWDAVMARRAEAALAPLLPDVRFHSVGPDEVVAKAPAWRKEYGLVVGVPSNATRAPFMGSLLCPQRL